MYIYAYIYMYIYTYIYLYIRVHIRLYIYFNLHFNLPGNLLSAVVLVRTNQCSHWLKNDPIMPGRTIGNKTLAIIDRGESSFGTVVSVVDSAKNLYWKNTVQQGLYTYQYYLCRSIPTSSSREPRVPIKSRQIAKNAICFAAGQHFQHALESHL